MSDQPLTEIDNSPLTRTESAWLEKLETQFVNDRTQFINGFYGMGEALMTIRDNRLYRAEYGTFGNYCNQRWNLSATHINRLITATKIFDNLTPMDAIFGVETSAFEPSGVIFPTSERQIRSLGSLTPPEQISAWSRAIEIAGGVPNGPQVEQAAYEVTGRQKPKTMRAADEYQPQGNDACQTPAYALDPLLPYLDTARAVWEPAAGDHQITEALFDSYFDTVIESDILTGQNFFEYEPAEAWDMIVTNPPYTLKYRWLERCYQLGKPFALLVPVETLGAAQAQILLKEYGFEIMLLDRRVNFRMPNKGYTGSGAQFPVLWLCWHVLPEKVMFGHIEYPTDDPV